MVTENDKAKKPRVRVTTAKADTTEVSKTPTPVKKRAPRKTTAKPTPPPVVEEPVVTEPETKSILPRLDDNDVEEIIPAEEKHEIITSEADEIVNALDERASEYRLTGSVEYDISKDSFNIAAVNGNSDHNYPLGVWVRNPFSLAALSGAAEQRVLNDEAQINDATILDYANQNAATLDPLFQMFFARKGAKWANYLQVGERKVRNSMAAYSAGSVGGSTERVVAALMRKLQTGTPVIVRLWASGLVFSINPPSKSDVIAMVDMLNAAHLETLRRTNGLIHGTSSYYANRIIINEFMKHVTASNIDRSLWPDIMNLLDHRDIQLVALGLKQATNPRGQLLIENCGGFKEVLNADGTPSLREDGEVMKTSCGYRHEEIIDFKLMQAIDNSMFTEWQKEFMIRPLDENNPATREDIEKYQSQGEMHKSDTIVIDDEVSVIIKPPKAGLHIEIGEEWINSVETAVNNIIGNDADEVTMSGYIARQLEATSSLDVAHWVDGFLLNGEEIRDRDGINTVFRSLSNNPNLRDDLFERIRKGMIARLPAVPAIPTFECPGCHKLSNVIQNNGTAFYTPVDMVARFFIQAARSQ